MIAALALLALVLSLGWYAHRRLVIVTVSGGSMEPALRDGDRLLVRRTRSVSAGQIVVLSRPAGVATESPWIVKRVYALVPPDRVAVAGDNPRSHDSRQLGPLPSASLLGVAVRRWRTKDSGPTAGVAGASASAVGWACAPTPPLEES